MRSALVHRHLCTALIGATVLVATINCTRDQQWNIMIIAVDIDTLRTVSRAANVEVVVQVFL